MKRFFSTLLFLAFWQNIGRWFRRSASAKTKPAQQSALRPLPNWPVSTKPTKVTKSYPNPFP